MLGANDGIISTASLIVGVASANASHRDILIAGIASLVAGALSMAAGEYVSVSSQKDAELADIAMEKQSIARDRRGETQELTHIYEKRGLPSGLARQVAETLMARDALAAHTRDDIGLLEETRAQPLLAALFSAVCFIAGAALPIATVWMAPASLTKEAVVVIALCCLTCLGGFAAFLGGASLSSGAGRVFFWGAVAMSVTALIGQLMGEIV